MDAQTPRRTFAPDPDKRRTVKVRPEAFAADALTAYGWDSLHAGALACGLSPSTLGRAVRGEIDAGPVLIGSLLNGVRQRGKRVTFGALFYIDRA